MKLNRTCGNALCLLLAIPVFFASGQAKAAVLTIDASVPSAAPQPSSYQVTNATSRSGRTLGINSRYLTLDGEPWLPVMGEFHYARVPEAQWEEEILKMKAAGVEIVSTYVFWIFQEEVEGQFDWSGRRDLRHFVELCAKHGMYVWVRIGPWDHGEVRNGGLPDWLLKKGPTRRNDPIFMHYVAQFYGQIGDQLRGLLWKDGGPVIGVQLENEYAMRGPEEGSAYILALKKLAIASGLEVPFYTVTGWDNAIVPKGAVIPVFGGYPDAPWDASLKKLPPGEVYLFRFGSRVAGNMGMMGAGANRGPSEANASNVPFITAEIGGGIQDTYHRRPVVDADDIAAIMPTMLGSGVNLYGTYMFQGGENPNGKLSTLEESQATGYPNDLPIKSYNFQAPLGEFGQERESFRKLKVFDYFVEDFGSALAPMSPHAPRRMPVSASDFSVIRAAVRSRGDHGFLFVNNYVRGYAMPMRKDAQFRILLPGANLLLPAHPVNIPSGAYFIWPFNLSLGPARLQYSTAQLFTRMTDGATAIWFFEEIPGIPAEFVLKKEPGLRVDAPAAKVDDRSGTLVISHLRAGFDHPVTVHTAAGTARLIVLTQHQAENAWKARIHGGDVLVETDQQFFADHQHLFLQARGTPRCNFEIYPRLARPLTAQNVKLAVEREGGATAYKATLPAKNIDFQLRRMRKAGEVPSVRLGPAPPRRSHGVAMAPSASAFASAAVWEVRIPADFLNGVGNVFLDINYVGDVARLSSRGVLLDDDFYNGLPWTVGLKRFSESIREGPVTLEILPLRKDAPIYLERRFWPRFGSETQAMKLRDVKLVPQYQFTIRAYPD